MRWNSMWVLVLAMACVACDGSDPEPFDTSTPVDQDVTQHQSGDLLDPDHGKPKCAGTFAIEDLDGNPVEAPTEDIDWLFDRTQMRKFDVEMDPEDWADLKANALDEEYLPANLVFEGRRYKGLGIRFKGAWSSLEGCFENGVQVCPKLSLKMRFSKYDSCGRFYGLRRLIFNSGLADTTMMREPIMYGIYTHLGIDVPRSSHALLRVNGEPFSVFILVEPVDKEFIQARWDEDEGNLYKEAWPTHKDEWLLTQSLRTNEEEADLSRILGFADVVMNGTDEDFAADISAYTDLADLARILAVGRIISDEDGLTRFWCFDMFGDCENHNFYWYDEPGHGFRLIPWDMDVTFYGVMDADHFSAHWWQTQPDKCEPVPQWVLEDPENPDPYMDKLVLPPQCDRLMHMAVSHHPDVYNDTLEKLVPALEQARTDLDSFGVKLQDALMDDPLYPSDLEKFLNDTAWFKKKIGQQIDAVTTHLSTLD